MSTSHQNGFCMLVELPHKHFPQDQRGQRRMQWWCSGPWEPLITAYHSTFDSFGYYLPDKAKEYSYVLRQPFVVRCLCPTAQWYHAVILMLTLKCIFLCPRRDVPFCACSYALRIAQVCTRPFESCTGKCGTVALFTGSVNPMPAWKILQLAPN